MTLQELLDYTLTGTESDKEFISNALDYINNPDNTQEDKAKLIDKYNIASGGSVDTDDNTKSDEKIEQFEKSIDESFKQKVPKRLPKLHKLYEEIQPIEGVKQDDEIVVNHPEEGEIKVDAVDVNENRIIWHSKQHKMLGICNLKKKVNK